MTRLASRPRRAWPPGTGTTWVAERLARLLVGSGRGIVDTVQFHPAYGYEDFVAGIAPAVSAGGVLTYETRPGRFLEFCDLARDAEGDPCVLVIDELNRADISRVFGEVMHLLEYREKLIRLANGPEDGRFSIPANVYVVATMNSADRSLALLDHALRRRFSFIRLGPQYDVLRERLARDGLAADGLVAVLVELNAEIADPDFEVGISFFMGSGIELPAAMPAIWDGEIVPYVVEIMHALRDTRERWSWSAVRNRLAAWYEHTEPPRGPS
jgi:5-methylcytosine-specific restriction protein B